MGDRKPDKTIPFTHVKHADGSEEWEPGQNRFNAAVHQEKPVADLNNPANMTRQGRSGKIESDQPIRGGRSKPLENTDDTKNSPII